MEKRNTDRIEDLPTVETPEDVAVLYSWANLHGAKYRDFSASRREYRAQLRHRAAEQARELELRAQASAETAATLAERAVRQAEEIAMANQTRETEHAHQQAMLQAEEAALVASAERIEAARRAEAAGLAGAAARREEREIADANASARRQAAQYADSEVRRRQPSEYRDDTSELATALPGQISDPYTPQPNAQPRPLPSNQPPPSQQAPAPQAPPPQDPVYQAPVHQPPIHQPPVHQAPTQSNPVHLTPATDAVRDSKSSGAGYSAAPPPTRDTTPPPSSIEYAPAPPPAAAISAPPTRRPQGYRPDDASGVRQIYRGPEFESSRDNRRSPAPRQSVPAQEPSQSIPQTSSRQGRPADPPSPRQDESDPKSQQPTEISLRTAASTQDRASAWSDGIVPRTRPETLQPPRQAGSGFASPALPPTYVSVQPPRVPQDPQASRSRSMSPFAEPETQESSADPTPRRRRQDAPGYREEHPSDSGSHRRRDDVINYHLQQQLKTVSNGRAPAEEQVQRPPSVPEPTGPAWLYATAPPQPDLAPTPLPPQSSVADTLQHSRERVASRWYALKGVFEQPGQEQAEPAPVRQKEVRTPILAVFSMAGGVGKTSLVATLGRSLSSLGEKVLLTDTTSHGLLPFYFGASELRQGTVRTFSPPSGSTDAPIYLVSYDVEGRAGDEPAQETLIDEITSSSRGTHRVLLDLTVSSGWILRRMARLSPTILVPVAADMNSVISLQAVEKYFDGVVDAEGRPLKIFYLLNQFDASLPLHLDIREVLRRQLGERLLPFVIRRAPAVGEALAEGMTIVDYSPEAPVAEDYLNAATWLRTVAAPATAGFRNVRWSER